jgi:hypothetical protein
MVCFLWFMLACQSAGIYMADARAQALDLVSLGGALAGEDTAIHDWHFIFDKLGMLQWDTLIGNSVRGLGTLAGSFGLGFGAWLIYKMAASQDARPLDKSEEAFLETTRAIAQNANAKKPPAGGKPSIYPNASTGPAANHEPQPPIPPRPKPPAD